MRFCAALVGGFPNPPPGQRFSSSPSTWSPFYSITTMSQTNPIQILIADDHPMIRSALKSIIHNEPDMVLVGEARDGEQAIALYRELHPDLVLMDLNMPLLSGWEAIHAILNINPAARIVILTNADSGEDVRMGFEAGAKGYLLKDAPQAQLTSVIRSVFAGNTFLPRSLAERITNHEMIKKLSERELSILRQVMFGKSNQAIGNKFGISESTVKTHLKNILLKLGVNDRTQAVRKALQIGLLRMNDTDDDG